MAQHQQTVLTDDLEGPDTPAAETVTFALDGVPYEIDLTEANAARLREDFSTWVGHGRRTNGRGAPAARAPRGRGRTSSPGAGDVDTAAVRVWARENGHSVNERGRIASPVLEAYQAAHA